MHGDVQLIGKQAGGEAGGHVGERQVLPEQRKQAW